MRLIIASNNGDKIAEIKSILSPYFDDIVSQGEAGIHLDVEETGATFRDNAYLKAKAIKATKPDCAVLADDSGLCVDALDGQPGVHSARYAGEPCVIANNNALLLKNMKDIQDRRAHFICHVTLITNDDRVFDAEGITYGDILRSPRGTNGFGYDPLFYSYDLCQAFGAASAHNKNLVSHRYRALKKLVEMVRKGI